MRSRMHKHMGKWEHMIYECLGMWGAWKMWSVWTCEHEIKYFFNDDKWMHEYVSMWAQIVYHGRWHVKCMGILAIYGRK